MAHAPAPADNPWTVAFGLLSAKLRRHFWSVLLCALIGTGLGLIAKTYLPRTYYANAQLLFDPQGLKVFNNAIKAGYYDANSAINYVESQMVVIRSERVLSRVIEGECAAIAKRPTRLVVPSSTSVRHGFSKFCPNGGANANWARALQALERSVNVYRKGRSFVVNVQASGHTPASAARLASVVVKAYRDEDAATRAAAAQKLTSELKARLQQLRRNLIEAEARAEEYAQSRNLLRVDGKLVVERRLSDATTALRDAALRLEKARLRLRMARRGRRMSGSSNADGGAELSPALRQIRSGRAHLQMQIAELSKRAGRRHPDLIALRAKLARLNRSAGGQLASPLRAAQAQFRVAREEYDNQNAIVKRLTKEFSDTDRANIELRAIKQQVDANRRLVEQFESRAREAAEFGRIDAGNLRIVSKARIPPKGRFWPRFILAGVIGGMLGVMIGVSGVLLATFLSMGKSRKPAPQMLDADDIRNLRSIAAEMRRREARPLAAPRPAPDFRARNQRRYG
ncbi:MAG: GumC family protein [Hyphomicrobiales bacterium]|nr:GumC family protein [Hyphomicrobiales bacterium]